MNTGQSLITIGAMMLLSVTVLRVKTANTPNLVSIKVEFEQYHRLRKTFPLPLVPETATVYCPFTVPFRLMHSYPPAFPGTGKYEIVSWLE